MMIEEEKSEEEKEKNVDLRARFWHLSIYKYIHKKAMETYSSSWNTTKKDEECARAV